MKAPNRNLAWATAIWDALASVGAQRIVLCPGHRSAPLALTAREPVVLIDERSAAFFALGHAKATGKPAVVVTTSGTAVANLLPAAIEAHESGTPLVFLTADRPPRLRGVGANQAIEQWDLFGRHVVASVDLPVPAASSPSFTELAQELADVLRHLPRGPIHINVPFEEPLGAAPMPDDEVALAALEPVALPAMHMPPSETHLAAAATVAVSKRLLVIVGPLRPSPDERVALAELILQKGAVLLADPLSGLRYGNPDAISSYDAFLAAGFDGGAPELVLRVGAAPTSKALLEWLGKQACPQLIVRPDARLHDHGVPGTVLKHTDFVAFTAACRNDAARCPPEWHAGWHQVDRTTRGMPASMGGGIVLQMVAGRLQRNDALWVSSSLPVRDLDRFVPATALRIEALANRGASGIDGVISSAAGAAAAFPQRRTVLVIGDLAFQHDLGGLAAAARLAPQLSIIVLQNGGGSIFRHLSVVTEPSFEERFLTPQSLDIASACKAFGLSHTRCDILGLEAAWGTARVIEVVYDGASEAAARKAQLDTVRVRLSRS